MDYYKFKHEFDNYHQQPHLRVNELYLIMLPKNLM